MTKSAKIVLAAVGAFALGGSALVALGVFFLWQVGEGTRLSRLGYEKMLQKDYEGAIKDLGEASRKVVLGDNRFWLHVNLGTAEIHRKQYDEAIKELTRAIEIDPNRPDPYDWRGNAYEHKQEIDKALADYSRAIELDPNRGNSHLKRGQILYDRDEIDKALTDFQEVVRIWPNYAHGFIMRARCYSRQEEPDLNRALANFDVALMMEPWNRALHGERAKIYLRLGDSERAFFDTAEAQRSTGVPRPPRKPSPPSTRDKLGLSPGPLGVAPLPKIGKKEKASDQVELQVFAKDYDESIKKGDYSHAVEVCNKMLASQLSSQQASIVTMNRGAASWENGDYDKAEKDYDEAARLNPRNPLAYVYRGIGLTDRGELDDALKDYAEAIRIDPREYAAYAYRGFTFFYLGNFQDALTNFGKAIELDPTRAEAYLGRAVVNDRRKKYSEALADCATGIERHPDVVFAYTQRALIYLRTGKFDLAEQELKSGKGVAHREEIALHDMTAWLRATCPEDRRRNHVEALAEAKRSCEMVHWSRWRPLDTLAAAEAEAGDFRKAVEYEERALQMEVPPVFRDEVEARLSLFRQHKPYRETGAN